MHKVASRQAQMTEPANTLGDMKRLTIDVPRGVHRRLKTLAARRDVTMARLLREMLLERLAREDG